MQLSRARRLPTRLPQRTVVNHGAIPHAEREAATMDEHAAHLLHCQRLIGKKLQPMLTEDHVKARIRQSKIERAALEPFDRGASRVLGAIA